MQPMVLELGLEQASHSAFRAKPISLQRLTLDKMKGPSVWPTKFSNGPKAQHIKSDWVGSLGLLGFSQGPAFHFSLPVVENSFLFFIVKILNIQQQRVTHKGKGLTMMIFFSPMVKHTSIKTVLGLVAHFDMQLEQMDVKTTFLHGDLEELVYMVQPKGFIQLGQEHLVCKLRKSLYGLKQSPRQWYK